MRVSHIIFDWTNCHYGLIRYRSLESQYMISWAFMQPNIIWRFIMDWWVHQPRLLFIHSSLSPWLNSRSTHSTSSAVTSLPFPVFSVHHIFLPPISWINLKDVSSQFKLLHTSRALLPPQKHLSSFTFLSQNLFSFSRRGQTFPSWIPLSSHLSLQRSHSLCSPCNDGETVATSHRSTAFAHTLTGVHIALHYEALKDMHLPVSLSLPVCPSDSRTLEQEVPYEYWFKCNQNWSFKKTWTQSSQCKTRTVCGFPMDQFCIQTASWRE